MKHVNLSYACGLRIYRRAAALQAVQLTRKKCMVTVTRTHWSSQ